MFASLSGLEVALIVLGSVFLGLLLGMTCWKMWDACIVTDESGKKEAEDLERLTSI